MTTARAETGVRSILRELLSYKSGIFGIIFLMILLSISVYTVFTIPYGEAISMWRGEGGMWLDNPRNAQPKWVNFFGSNLPDTIILDSSNKGVVGVSKIITAVPNSEINLLRMKFSFEYDYTDFPTEINLFFKAKYETSAPLLKIYWIKPGGTQVKLADYIVKAKADQFYISTNQKILEIVQKYVADTVGGPPQTTIAVEKALFAVEDETMSSSQTITPMKGKYEMLIEGTFFEKDVDLDAKLVVYGKVYGLAGTDHLRRDLTVSLLWGTPIALAFGLTAAMTISFIQLVLATISGYYGGKIDSTIQRLTEVSMILPFLPILIMIAAFYQIDIWKTLVVLIILSIFGAGVKSTRALVLQIKEYPYIEAARAYGASSARIVFLYIIPKILPPIVPNLIGSVPGYVFLEAALAFLGLGDPRLPTWGKMINDSYVEGAIYKGYYYWVLEPGLLLVLTAFTFSFLGFALDKIVNPKLKEV